MAGVLIDYQIKGWAQKNEGKIRKAHSGIRYVGDPVGVLVYPFDALHAVRQCRATYVLGHSCSNVPRITNDLPRRTTLATENRTQCF